MHSRGVKTEFVAFRAEPRHLIKLRQIADRLGFEANQSTALRWAIESAELPGAPAGAGGQQREGEALR